MTYSFYHVYIEFDKDLYVLDCQGEASDWEEHFAHLLRVKWNESGFRPPLCTYRLNWARRTSWGWWDDWDDPVLQTQDSNFEPWRSEAEYATSRSRKLPTILTFTRGWGRNIYRFFETAETGNRTPNSGVKGSGANHYPRAPALISSRPISQQLQNICITFIQCRPNVFDVGPTWYKCYTNVLCLMEYELFYPYVYII